MEEFTPPSDYNLVKINVANIEPGMYMSQPDRPWLETSFLFQGFLLDNPEVIGKVKNECQFIYVDVKKSDISPARIYRLRAETVHKPPAHATASQIKRVIPIDADKHFKPIEKVIKTAYKKHKETLSDITETLSSISHGEGFNVTRIKNSVKSCVSSIMDNPNALLWLSKLRNRDSYTAEHCLNVGILAIALGRHLGMAPAKLEILGLCGMLHDVGKMHVDQAILNKPSRLTSEEFAVVQSHCKLGRDILLRDGNLPQATIEAAYGHHERIDAGGYPQGLHAGMLNLYTRIISIVDAYDAITTNRCYDNSRPATEAIRILFMGRDIQFDAWLVEQFIECLGIYPTGSLVELHSQEGAVVIDSNRTCRLHPKVAIVLDEKKHNRTPLIVDTRAYETTSGERTVKRVLDENDFKIDLEDIFSHFRM